MDSYPLRHRARSRLSSCRSARTVDTARACSACAREPPCQGRNHDGGGDGVQGDQGGRGGRVEAEGEIRDEGQCGQARRTSARTSARGRRALRAMTAATPTPTSEKTRVSCANPAIGMLAPVLSANETPAADAIVTRGRSWPPRHHGSGDSALPDGLPLDRSGGRAGGDLRGGGHVELLPRRAAGVRPVPALSTNVRPRIRHVAGRDGFWVSAVGVHPPRPRTASGRSLRVTGCPWLVSVCRTHRPPRRTT